tara:strand:- start:28821 stop:29660 length:840 start_codon:yes stop_codon:yes gene_type:complete
MDDRQTDYLFDLQGYLVLERAICDEDLAELNTWVDAHWDYVKNPKVGEENRWIGHVETHSYGPEDGVNFQNIVEGGAIFERLIDHPGWIDLARKYINPVNKVSIHENFLNVRDKGGHLFIHCGGHAPLSYLTFRQHNTGEWMVGQINVLMALEDIGPGDGPTVLIPGSHKTTEVHPRLMVDGKGIVSAGSGSEPAGTAFGVKEMYLKAGDVLFFTDAITHGSAERTNEGFRRSIVYRYSARHLRSRFNYVMSDELRARLTPERLEILEPIPARSPEQAL